MTVYLTGLGTAVPRHHIQQSEAAELVGPWNARNDDELRLLKELYRRSGVQQRHSVILESSAGSSGARQSFYRTAQQGSDNTRSSSEDESTTTVASMPILRSDGPSTACRMEQYAAHAGTLGHEAASLALRQADCAASDITHLVTVSCTGFRAPGFDIELLQSLGLPPSVARTHVGFMGCHGALNGLRVAAAFLNADPAAKVLLVAVELCSLHHQYGWAPDRIVSNALFADGAGAVVLTSIREPDTTSSRKYADFIQYRGSRSLVVAGSLDEMTWQIGNHGFEMTLSARVPDLIQRHLRPWLSEWLSVWKLQVEDIAHWAIHPGGPRILAACGEALGLQRSQWQASAEVLASCGNMSSPTVLFILKRLLELEVRGPIVSLAFGPGLTIEAALFGI